MATPNNPSDHKNEKGLIKAAIDEESTAEELLDENDNDDFEFPDIESDSFLEQLFDIKKGRQYGHTE